MAADDADKCYRRFFAQVRSPRTLGYRNKCDFTCGLSADAAPCVGFQLGKFRENVFAVRADGTALASI